MKRSPCCLSLSVGQYRTHISCRGGRGKGREGKERGDEGRGGEGTKDAAG